MTATQRPRSFKDCPHDDIGEGGTCSECGGYYDNRGRIVPDEEPTANIPTETMAELVSTGRV